MREFKAQFSVLSEYWQELFDCRKDYAEAHGLPVLTIPYRTAFNPMKIVSVLPNISFCERQGRYDWTVRVRGTSLEASLPYDLQNRNLFSIYDPSEWEKYAAFYEAIGETPCGGYCRRTVTLTNGQSFVVVRLTYPLAAPDGSSKFTVSLVFRQNDYSDIKDQDQTIQSSRLFEMEYLDVGFGCPL